MRALASQIVMLTFAAMIGDAGFTDRAHAQVVVNPPAASIPPAFAKQALDNKGVALTGPVSVGQTIQYVLSYKPGTFSLSPATIDDTLSSSLTYVNGSLATPPGWTWNPLLPYSVGNHTQYSNASVGPGTSFVVNVPVSDRALVGQTGGDGTLPIPVGVRVYGIQHHLNPGSIMCWELSSFAKCTGTWPRSIGSDLMTPTIVRHVVVGTTIYFPSARVAGSGGTATTTPGVACWDTLTDTACPFTALPGGPVWTGNLPVYGSSALDTVLSGVAADPVVGRLFMYAVDSAAAPANGQVYCVPLPTSPGACSGWSTTTMLTAGGNSAADMILEQTGGTPATRLYVANATKITCLSLPSNGLPCAPSWINVPTSLPRGLTLSPFMDPAGSAMTQVCLHPYPNGLPDCRDALTGAAKPLGGNPAFLAAMTGSSGKYVFAAYRVPGTARVLYPNGTDSNATSPLCFDFGLGGGTGGPCTSFSPAWTSNGFRDYGYAVDPAEPDRCLLGLGDAGFVWRFTRDGGFDANGCVKRVEAKLDINSFFCAIKPKEAKWGSIVIRNRPTQLTGGTITLVNTAGQTVNTTTVTATGSTYAVNILATGANSQLTLQFTPTYSPGPPSNGYQIELTFAADVDPQICYQASVKACGPVFNNATLAGSLVGTGAATPFSTKAGIEFGNASGLECTGENAGLLKVCKVAGPGIAVGTQFNFTAGANTFSVPAGPPPGGTCVVGPTFPVGSNVIVDEAVPAGHTVSSIAVAPPKQLVGAPNLAAGSVNVIIGSGVTVVTFTDKLTGYLEICKRGEVKGNFSFTVNPGGLGPFVVPAGACSPPIEVVAGPVIVNELQTTGTAMVECTTYPAVRQGLCNPGGLTSTVTVVPGDVSTETIAFITNRRSSGDTTTPGSQ